MMMMKRNRPNSGTRTVRTPVLQEYLAQLTEVDLRMLRWLLHYPFQRINDLVIALDRWVSRATVYRHVQELEHKGLIEPLLPGMPSSGAPLYYLSNAGLHLYAAQLHVPARELARHWHADEQGLVHLLPRLPTLSVLQQFVNGLVSHVAQSFSLQGLRPDLVTWNWQRDFSTRFTYREKLLRLTADGALAMCIRTALSDDRYCEQWYSALLFHTDVHEKRLMRTRLERVLCWRECAQRWPLYQYMPLVIILATSPHQSEYWHQCAQEAATRLRVNALTGTVACFSPSSPSSPSSPPTHTESYASSNPWLLSWRSLATYAHTHVQNLLSPMPQAAIPTPLCSVGSVEDEQKNASTAIGTTSRATVPNSTTISPISNISNISLIPRRLSRIIQGNFEQRCFHGLAQTKQMKQMKQTKQTNKSEDLHEEEEVESLALLAPRLTARMGSMLTLLFDHPFLSVSDLAPLLGLQVKSVRCCLYELRSLGCIESISTEVGQRWQLSQRGLRLFAAMHHVNVRNFVERASSTASGAPTCVLRGQQGLLQHLQHTAEVYSFFALLVRTTTSAQERWHEDLGLLWWETGAACERRYRLGERWYNLRPDALAEYCMEGGRGRDSKRESGSGGSGGSGGGRKRIRFWLEWDRGTMNVRDLTLKFSTYARYAASREWAREKTALPLLLCVVPDIAQEKRITRVAQATLAHTQELQMYSTTAPQLRDRGPLAPIWLVGQQYSGPVMQSVQKPERIPQRQSLFSE